MRKTIREAIEAELRRQSAERIGYVSVNEDGEAVVDCHLDLEEMATAIHKRLLGEQYVALVGYDPFVDDPTQTVEQVEELIAGVRAELGGRESLRTYVYDCDRGQGSVRAQVSRLRPGRP